MDGVATEHPDVASVISIGKSYEGRDTRLLKVTTAMMSDDTVASYHDHSYYGL